MRLISCRAFYFERAEGTLQDEPGVGAGSESMILKWGESSLWRKVNMNTG